MGFEMGPSCNIVHTTDKIWNPVFSLSRTGTCVAEAMSTNAVVLFMTTANRWRKFFSATMTIFGFYERFQAPASLDLTRSEVDIRGHVFTQRVLPGAG